jgi:uncharacterized protein YueI
MSIITSKWYANQAIDTIQTAKSTALKQLVKDDKVRSPLQSFIDAQTSFAKEMVRISDEIYNVSLSQVTKMTEASK